MATRHNVLILSAGRRVDLVEAFQNALRQHLPDARVYATDLVPARSSACHVADGAFTVPRAGAPDYIDALLSLCDRHDIGLVIPTIDTELLTLSQHASRFANIGSKAVISDPTLVTACRDKRRTAQLFAQLDIDQPRLYGVGDIPIPCFCKPVDGSRSIGAMPILTPDALRPELVADARNMFMEWIGPDHQEFTMDAYYNRHGELCCLVPRERLEVRSGEVSKGATRRNGVYDYFLLKLRHLRGAIGCLTVQTFYQPDTHAFKALEINPRFGGGYPLTHAAGANYPDWLIREYLLGEEIAFSDDWTADLLMLRYDAKVIVHDMP